MSRRLPLLVMISSFFLLPDGEHRIALVLSFSGLFWLLLVLFLFFSFSFSFKHSYISLLTALITGHDH